MAERSKLCLLKHIGSMFAWTFYMKEPRAYSNFWKAPCLGPKPWMAKYEDLKGKSKLILGRTRPSPTWSCLGINDDEHINKTIFELDTQTDWLVMKAILFEILKQATSIYDGFHLNSQKHISGNPGSGLVDFVIEHPDALIIIKEAKRKYQLFSAFPTFSLLSSNILHLPSTL